MHVYTEQIPRIYVSGGFPHVILLHELLSLLQDLHVSPVALPVFLPVLPHQLVSVQHALTVPSFLPIMSGKVGKIVSEVGSSVDKHV